MFRIQNGGNVAVLHAQKGARVNDSNIGPLTIEVDADGSLIVKGDIDMAGGPILEQHLRTHEVSKNPLVIDVGGVEFIDSSGLRSLLGASRRAEARSSRVVLRDVGPQIARLLEITNTTDLFEIQSAS